MIKHRWVSAEWSRKDASFLRQKGIDIDVEGGFNIIKINEDDPIYLELKDSFFAKTRKDFKDEHVASTFSEKELDSCGYYAFFVTEKGYPQPNPGNRGYLRKTYVDYYQYSLIPKKGQQNPFILKGEPKWDKKNKAFTLIGVYDALFVNRDFFDEYLKPRGYKSREVHINTKGDISKGTVQWDLPICNSKMMLDNTWYDQGDNCLESGIKRYSPQILDFLPPFEEKPEYDVCLSYEYFGNYNMSNRRFIASRKMVDLFLDRGFLTSKKQLHPIKD
ncbi:MAG: hypothetical protein AAF600_02710 [Bacteroidota bacterium]